jgi:hypothetical protein
MVASLLPVIGRSAPRQLLHRASLVEAGVSGLAFDPTST